MHKIDRITPEPPELAEARKTYSCWDDFPYQKKKQVRDTLLIMQNLLCAYCERQLHEDSYTEEDKWDGHIEHFRRKNIKFHPELTFVWNNLFYSCLTSNTCGKHKDRYVKTKEQYDLLIDPGEDNPEDYFVFDKEGRLAIREGLSEAAREKASFTLNAFNLNETRLVQKRKECLRAYEWLKEYSSGDRQRYLCELRQQPFVTAIFHYFGERVV